MKPDIGFTKHVPRSVVGTKLDSTLPDPVFIGIATGKLQLKSWKGIRKIESHFRSAFPAQKTVARGGEMRSWLEAYAVNRWMSRTVTPTVT